jgi:uncharacterized protein (DUF433 family)
MSKNITIDQNIMGGMPVISGTRITVKRILTLFTHDYTIEEIQTLYPQLSLKKLQDVLEEIAEGYGKQI